MAYFRNKSKGETPEIQSEPLNIPVELLPDEDQLQREPGSPAEPPRPAPQTAQPVTPQGDAASDLLRSHMDALKRSEQIAQQRQAAAVAEQRRVAWLQNTPAAQKHYAALGPLHMEAMKAGFQDLTPEYFRYLEGGLAALAQEQPQDQLAVETVEQPMPAERPAPPAATQPAPEFFRPVAPKLSAQRQVQVSAPVSRTIPSANRDLMSTDPKHVRLSPAQREAAKIAGISELEYARGMVAIDREKREGRRRPVRRGILLTLALPAPLHGTCAVAHTRAA